MGLIMSDQDEIITALVHYFITEENYTPIIVKGAKDEIWLENMDAPYRVVRLNSNSIFNEEQFNYDVLKTKGVLKQIKKKTFSLQMNVLTIYLDIDKLPEKEIKGMDFIKVKSISDIINNDELTSVFKKMKTKLSTKQIDIEELISKTEDINKKTEKKNKTYEHIFSPKQPIITRIIMLVCIIYFGIMFFKLEGDFSAINLVGYGAVQRGLVQSGEWYRLFTCIFVHGSILHIFFNMYALKIIGEQLESYVGKLRFALIFILSGLTGSLFSTIFSKYVSVGASGAIFGLLGALVYFAYHYRLVLGDNLKNQILPIAIINLALGFIITGIDVYAHIGGFIGGIFALMALGVPGKINKKSIINGTICLTLLIGFLSYILFYYI